MHEFVTYRGVEIEVSGTYVAAEKPVIAADPNDSYPGSESCVEEHEFHMQGEDVTDLLEEVMDDILDLAIEQYEEEELGA